MNIEKSIFFQIQDSLTKWIVTWKFISVLLILLESKCITVCLSHRQEEDNCNIFERVKAKSIIGEKKAKVMDFIQQTKRSRWRKDLNSIADWGVNTLIIQILLREN